MVAAVGAGVSEKQARVGMRVMQHHYRGCGFCAHCSTGWMQLCVEGVAEIYGVTANGAHARYLKGPARTMVPLPDAIDDEIGAILDPLGNAVHTALSFDLIGEDVLITGAGPIGIMAAAVARHVGARHVVITDVNEYRTESLHHRGNRCARYIKQHVVDIAGDVIRI